MKLTDVFRVFHPATAQYTFFSEAHGTFSEIYHILGHKASLNKYKKIEITLCKLSDHNSIKLELNNKSNSSSLKKINKIDKPLANLTKMRREKPKLIKLETKKGR
jgi:hypothetical protein